MKIADLGQIDLTPGGGSKEVTFRNTTITYGINRDGKTGSIDLVLTPRGKRNNGSAREALTTFLKATDAAGITIFLTAEPRDKGITKGGLVDFYKSLGFKQNSGRARDFRSMNGMVRQPKTLTENANQIDTPEFKRWFAGSKVVDQNGAPLVVYHGTVGDFHTFSKMAANDRGLWGRGFYFSALMDAPNSYALRQGDGANIIPCYVSIKNPLVLLTGKDLIIRLPDGTNTKELVGPNLDGSKIKEIAIAGGHDGVIQYRPNGMIGDIVAYNASQIKSAIGNNGAFDPDSLNITEGFNPFLGLDADSIPPDFKLVKDDKNYAKFATARAYRFIGDDGVPRLLHVTIGHPYDKNPDHYHHLSFDVTNENGQYYSEAYNHGRSGDVMQTVANVVKDHIARFDPPSVQWIASGALQRMYRAILAKAAPGYTYSVDGSIGSITKTLKENEDDFDWEGWEADVDPSFMQTPYIRDYPATDENIAKAKAFVWRKWIEFCQEKGREAPTDLSNSCKFGSMFAQEIFGGVLRGNNAHQYCLLPNGKIIDFSAEAADVLKLRQANLDPYEHNDRTFWGNPEHEDALMSCMPRVDRWAEEFRRENGLL